MKLIINKFDDLSTEVQEEIQDFIAGYTSNFEIVLPLECDVCGEHTEHPKKIDTYGGIIRVCNNCIIKANGRNI